MLRSIGKQSGESVKSVLESKGVVGDESGESMEPMDEVPLKELGESELERLVSGWRRDGRSWFQRRGKHTGRNDLLGLFVWCRWMSECDHKMRS